MVNFMLGVLLGLGLTYFRELCDYMGTHIKRNTLIIIDYMAGITRSTACHTRHILL